MLRKLDADICEYALLKAHGVEEKQCTLEDIAHEVATLTERLTGDQSKDVVDKEIELTVFRHDQDDLTLIDLPGMTRVPVKGQHQDIEATITAMYSRYMEPEETIILNVISAMVDFSTSKALQMSRELDAACRRSLLCITKVDQHQEAGLGEKVLPSRCCSFHFFGVHCQRGIPPPPLPPLGKKRDVGPKDSSGARVLCAQPQPARER
jgi:hypothetical protein